MIRKKWLVLYVCPLFPKTMLSVIFYVMMFNVVSEANVEYFVQ